MIIYRYLVSPSYLHICLICKYHRLSIQLHLLTITFLCTNMVQTALNTLLVGHHSCALLKDIFIPRPLPYFRHFTQMPHELEYTLFVLYQGSALITKTRLHRRLLTLWRFCDSWASTDHLTMDNRWRQTLSTSSSHLMKFGSSCFRIGNPSFLFVQKPGG